MNGVVLIFYETYGLHLVSGWIDNSQKIQACT